MIFRLPSWWMNRVPQGHIIIITHHDSAIPLSMDELDQQYLDSIPGDTIDPHFLTKTFAGDMLAVTSEDGMSETGSEEYQRVLLRKKPLDEMDEDERLLNSEEGKKLTSRERRQLRNKVSARHFRERRKEHITELEQNLQQHVSDNKGLQSENDALRRENQLLKSTLDNLISSPPIASYISTLVSSTQAVAAAASTEPSTPKSKDTNPNFTEDWPLAYASTSVFEVQTPEIHLSPIDIKAMDICSGSQSSSGFAQEAFDFAETVWKRLGLATE